MSHPSMWSTVPVALRQSLQICLGLNITIVFLVSAGLVFLQPVVPLFYSLALPVQHLANKNWLLLFPLLSLTITLAHFLLAYWGENLYHPLLIKWFLWVTCAWEGLIVLAVARILWITI